MSGEFDGEDPDLVLLRCGSKARLQYFHWLRTRKGMPQVVTYAVLDRLSEVQLKRECNTCGVEVKEAVEKGELLGALLEVLGRYP